MTTVMVALWHYFTLISGLTFLCLHYGECCSSRECMDTGCSTVTNGKDCYFFFSSIEANWSEAQNFCLERQMESAVVEDAQTSEILKTNAMGNSWLAGRANPLNKWTFVNGIDASSLVVSANIDQCVILSWHHHDGHSQVELTFSTKPCYERQRFFCRFDCYISKGGCTVLSTGLENWFEARRICKQNGGDLLYLKADEEKQQLQEVVDSGLYRKEGQAFIGIQHKHWMWHTPDGSQQEIGYTDWDYSQPKLGDCMHLRYYDAWGSDNCTSKKRVLCMRNLHPHPTDNNQPVGVSGFGSQGMMEIHSAVGGKDDKANEGTKDYNGGAEPDGPCKENVAVNGILLSVAIGSSALMLGLIVFIMCRGLRGGSSNQRNSSMKLREVSSWVEEDDNQTKRKSTQMTIPVAVQAKIKTPVYETVEELKCDASSNGMKEDLSSGSQKHRKNFRKPKATENFYHGLHRNNTPQAIPEKNMVFNAENYQECNDYDEIDEQSAGGQLQGQRNNSHYSGNPHIRYSNVSKMPKLSVDDGETVFIDNHIYG